MVFYPMSNFYVGRLNFVKDRTNPFDTVNVSEINKEMDSVKDSCIISGAKSVNWASNCALDDIENGVEYDSIFTLFYRSDVDEFCCLHNDQFYTSTGRIFVSDIVPLDVCIPSVGAVYLDREITRTDAEFYFTVLFEEKPSNLYSYYQKFSPDKFHFCDFKLYIGDTDSRETPNIAQRMLLLADGIKPYKSGQEIDPKTGATRNFRYYTVIGYWMDVADRIYNLNDHRVSGSYSMIDDGTKIEWGEPITSEEYFERKIKKDLSMARMIKLQRHFIDRNS